MGYVDAALILRNAYFSNLSAWVNNHGLFSLAGWIWMRALPFGTEFLRLNLLSMLFGAATVYVIFRACLEYTKSLWISALAGFALMTSHSLWWHSTMVEVYTLNTLLIALILFSIARYYTVDKKAWLYAALFFWGLGVSNHILMALLAPAFIVLILLERKRLSGRDYLIGIACLLAGLSIFLVGFVRSYLQSGSIIKVLDLVTGGDFRSLMFHGSAPLFWYLNYLFLIVYQYPSLMLVYLACGIAMLVVRPGRFDLIIIAALLPLAVWSSGYFVWDMYAFSLPVYVLLAFPIAKGLMLLREHKRLAVIAAVTALIPLFAYPLLARSPIMRSYASQYQMYRYVDTMFDPTEYFLSPDKAGFDDVKHYVTDLFAELPPRASYYDNVFDYPIRYYYQDVRHQRPDLHCPIVFVFWVTQDEVRSVSQDINRRLAAGTPVFTSQFVLDILRPELRVARLEPLTIDGRTVVRLY